MTHRRFFKVCVNAAPGPEAASRRGADGVAPGDPRTPLPGSVLFDARETRAEIVAELITVLAGLAPATAPSSSGGLRRACSIGTPR